MGSVADFISFLVCRKIDFKSVLVRSVIIGACHVESFFRNDSAACGILGFHAEKILSAFLRFDCK